MSESSQEQLPRGTSEDAWEHVRFRSLESIEAKRHQSRLRVISGIHAFSAFAMATSVVGVMLGAGNIRWPSWYLALMSLAAVLPAISGASAWLLRRPGLALPMAASVSVALPLVLAGYLTSPVLWLNVAVLVFVAYLMVSGRSAAKGT